MKVLTDYRADLRLDLKDAATTWSNAELDRCVQRAVGDLSRFRPRQKTADFIVDATVTAESFTTPAASDPDYYVTTVTLNGKADGGTFTLAARTPDMPRPVLITVTDAGTVITDLVIIVKGRDAYGNSIEEYFYLHNGLVQTLEKLFATVTEVEMHYMVGEDATCSIVVGTGSHIGVPVQLANKPIQFQSDTITGYARYTHYTMNYYDGTISLKTGTTMAAATAYSINYTKSKIRLDISSLDDLVRIERVEYPEGSVPQDFSTKEVWGDYLIVTSSAMQSQAEMSDDQHVLVFYEAEHQPPAESAPGTYPSFLYNTVLLAASAYALFIEALQYEHAAVTSVVALEAELALTTAVHTKVAAALTKVATYLETNGTTDNAVDVLSNITDDIADLRTKIITAEAAMATALGLVNTYSLDKATTGAEAYLDTGDDLINKLNDGGSDVASVYAQFSGTRAQIAQTRIQQVLAYAQEASVRLSNLRSYIEEAMGWVRMGETFVAEGNALIAQIDRYLAEASLYDNVTQSNLAIADRYRAEAIERRNEAWAIWADGSQYAPNYALGQRSQTSSV